MAPLYSAYAAEPVTVAQLLGEEEAEAEAQEAAMTAAAAKLDQMLDSRKERA